MLQAHSKNSDHLDHLFLKMETVLNIINLLYDKNEVTLNKRMEFLDNILILLEITRTYKWGWVEHKLNSSRQLS